MMQIDVISAADRTRAPRSSFRISSENVFHSLFVKEKIISETLPFFWNKPPISAINPQFQSEIESAFKTSQDFIHFRFGSIPTVMDCD
jgi:hypothetical protein